MTKIVSTKEANTTVDRTCVYCGGLIEKGTRYRSETYRDENRKLARQAAHVDCHVVVDTPEKVKRVHNTLPTVQVDDTSVPEHWEGNHRPTSRKNAAHRLFDELAANSEGDLKAARRLAEAQIVERFKVADVTAKNWTYAWLRMYKSKNQ